MSGSLPQRIAQGLPARKQLVLQGDTTCLRLLDGGSDDVLLDVYGQDLVLQVGVDLGPTPDAAAVDRAVAQGTELARQVAQWLQPRAVWLKLRPKQANTLVSAVSAGLTPNLPVWGHAPPLPLSALTGDPSSDSWDQPQQAGTQWVLEHGVRLRIELGRGLPTGLYLDMRDGRKLLQQQACGLRVLNTFAYTCGLSVAAAVGGAARTLSIDAAQPALDEGNKSLLANGFVDRTQHDLLRGDVLHWLPRLAKRGEQFDWVLLDPPSYAKVKDRRFSVLQDYPELVQLAAGVLAPGGRLLACVNHTAIDHLRLQRMVETGLQAAGRRANHWQRLPVAVDHEAGRCKGWVVHV
jgi:23S rRNA (cytosine1962-C5)-methyltransferase